MTRQMVYFFLSTLAPAAVLSLFFFLFTARYGLALINTLAIILIMEGRVQTSRRLPRGVLFFTHLFASVLFLASLLAVVYVSQPVWLLVVMWVSVVAQIATGSVLWYHGYKNSIVNL